MENYYTEDQSPSSKDLALFNLYKIGAVAATILTALMSIVLFGNNMQAHSRYFNNSSAVRFSLVLLALNICFALTPFVLLHGGASKTGSIPKICRCLFLIPSVTALFCACLVLFRSDFGVMTIALSTASLFSAIFTASYAVKMPKALSLISGYLQIIFMVLIISHLYMDLTVEMNAPIKLFIQFAAMAAIINTLADLRILIGKESVALFTFAKIAYLILSIFIAVAALIEVVPNIDEYGICYLLFPIYLFALSVPVAMQFFFTVLHEKAPAAKEDDIQKKEA